MYIVLVTVLLRIKDKSKSVKCNQATEFLTISPCLFDGICKQNRTNLNDNLSSSLSHSYDVLYSVSIHNSKLLITIDKQKKKQHQKITKTNLFLFPHSLRRERKENHDHLSRILVCCDWFIFSYSFNLIGLERMNGRDWLSGLF